MDQSVIILYKDHALILTGKSRTAKNMWVMASLLSLFGQTGLPQYPRSYFHICTIFIFICIIRKQDTQKYQYALHILSIQVLFLSGADVKGLCCDTCSTQQGVLLLSCEWRSATATTSLLLLQQILPLHAASSSSLALTYRQRRKHKHTNKYIQRSVLRTTVKPMFSPSL